MKYKKELAAYQEQLINDERSNHTIEKYMRDIKKFLVFLQDEILDKRIVLAFKEALIQNYEPTSVNSILAGVNVNFHTNCSSSLYSMVLSSN